MLIGAGIALYLLLFMGGAQDDLMIMHGEKYVKKVVVDKDRKGLILAEYKVIKGIQKSYQKMNKKNGKLLKELIKNYQTDETTFKSFFEKLAEDEEQVNDQFFSHRLIIQEKLTQEEWDEIMDKIQKSVSKDEKTVGKSLRSFEKDLAKMKSKILDVLNEDFRKDKAEAAINEFIESVKKSGKEIVEYAPDEKELLLEKNTSKKELDQLGDEIINQWLELLNAVATLHNELHDIATEEEWPKVSKWMNKI
jgi:hypothetical protein